MFCEVRVRFFEPLLCKTLFYNYQFILLQTKTRNSLFTRSSIRFYHWLHFLFLINVESKCSQFLQLETAIPAALILYYKSKAVKYLDRPKMLIVKFRLIGYFLNGSIFELFSNVQLLNLFQNFQILGIS